MENRNWFGWLVGGITLAGLVFVAALLLLKVLWAWTIPDLFPGAVESGLIAPQISWLTSFKVSLFIAALAGLTGSHRRVHSYRD
jgi:hypothetical protein